MNGRGPVSIPVHHKHFPLAIRIPHPLSISSANAGVRNAMLVPMYGKPESVRMWCIHPLKNPRAQTALTFEDSWKFVEIPEQPWAFSYESRRDQLIA